MRWNDGCGTFFTRRPRGKFQTAQLSTGAFVQFYIHTPSWAEKGLPRLPEAERNRALGMVIEAGGNLSCFKRCIRQVDRATGGYPTCHKLRYQPKEPCANLKLHT